MESFFSANPNSPHEYASSKQVSDGEHARKTREAIVAQWDIAKKEETARRLDQLSAAQRLVAGNGISGMALAEGMSAATANLLLTQKPEWVKDSLVTSCHVCARAFSLSRRRHHCRLCGNIVCDSCSRHRSLLPLRFEERETKRVCGPCHQKLEPVQDLLVKLKALKNRTNEKYNAAQQYRGQMNAPVKHTLSGEIRKAAYSIHNLFRPSVIEDTGLSKRLMQDAKGLVFLTVVKAGLFASLNIGTGCVIARLPSGEWSAPSAIYTVGFGFGAQVGGQITDFVTVLTTHDAVKAFFDDGVGRVAASAGVAVGPGRTAEASANARADGVFSGSFTYAQARGVFAGVSLELGGIRTRHSVNRNFYGRSISPADILRGVEQPPIAAAPLYEELKAAEGLFEAGELFGPIVQPLKHARTFESKRGEPGTGVAREGKVGE